MRISVLTSEWVCKSPDGLFGLNPRLNKQTKNFGFKNAIFFDFWNFVEPMKIAV